MADVERQRQADQRRHRVGQQVAEQVLAALAGAQQAPVAQAFGQQTAEHRQQGEHAEPDAGQQQEIAHHAHRRAFRRLIDQFIHFIRRPIGPQAPGVDQVVR